MISMGFVLLMSRRVHNMSMLVVSGVMIGYICSAITELVVTFASDAEIVNLHNWSREVFGNDMGKCSGYDRCGGCDFFSGVFDGKTIECLSVRGSLCKKFRCGYPAASHSHGSVIEYSIRLYRSFCRTNLLCRNCSTAFSKEPFRYGKTNLDDTCLFFRGSVFCLFCDLLARTMFAPTELSISTVTAIFGAPVVLWIMVRRNKEKMA